MTQEKIIADYKKERHITDEYVLDKYEMYFVEQIYNLHQKQVKNCSKPVILECFLQDKGLEYVKSLDFDSMKEQGIAYSSFLAGCKFIVANERV